jgi:hypothetical protein
LATGSIRLAGKTAVRRAKKCQFYHAEHGGRTLWFGRKTLNRKAVNLTLSCIVGVKCGGARAGRHAVRMARCRTCFGIKGALGNEHGKPERRISRGVSFTQQADMLFSSKACYDFGMFALTSPL